MKRTQLVLIIVLASTFRYFLSVNLKKCKSKTRFLFTISNEYARLTKFYYFTYSYEVL